MKAKIKAGVTIIVDENEDVNLADVKLVVRKYLTEGKFSLNEVVIKSEYDERN